MFGLTFDKLFLIAVLAAVLVGPTRLPSYARQAGDALRSFRRFLEASRAQAEQDLGISLTRAEWEALNLRSLDPRRVLRDALAETAPTGTSAPPGTGDPPETSAPPEASDPEGTGDPEGIESAERPGRFQSGDDLLRAAEVLREADLLRAAELVRPGQRYLVSGPAAHPRRILIASLPANDPRRVAAEAVEDIDTLDSSVDPRGETDL